jgi:hypothetical protein
MKIDIVDGVLVRKIPPMRGVPFYSDWLKVLLERGLAHEVTKRDPNTREIKTSIVPFDRDQEQAALVDDETGSVGIICCGCGKPMWSEVHGASINVSEMKLRRGGRLKKVGGAKFTAKFTDRIRIGGFIQTSYEEPYDTNEVIRKWKVMPMFKMGLGCEACRSKFAEIVKDANATNEFRKQYALLLLAAAKRENQPATIEWTDEMKKAMQERCLHGLKKLFCAVCQKYNPNRIPDRRIHVELPGEVTPFIDVFERDALDGPTSAIEFKERT